MAPRNSYANPLNLKMTILLSVGVTLLVVLIFVFSSQKFPSTSEVFPAQPDTAAPEQQGPSNASEFNTIEPEIPEPVVKPSKKPARRDEIVEVTIEINDSVVEASQAPAPMTRPYSEEDKIYTEVDKKATPIGGMSAFNDFVDRKLKYPVQATRMKVEGFVFVEFVVEKDGSLREVKPVKGIGTGCDEEAVRLVSAAPPWKPARHQGKIVRQKVMVAIPFDLDGKRRRK
jgi:periplasmic protein TonB